MIQYFYTFLQNICYEKHVGVQNFKISLLRIVEEHLILIFFHSIKVVELQTNMRQGDGSQYAEMLNRIRVGNQTADDEKLLETRRLTKESSERAENAVHVYYRRADVNQWNDKKLKSLATPLVTIDAEITGGGYIPKTKDDGTIGDSQFRRKLELKIGARVMLNFNVSIADSLVNGQMGKVMDIKYNKDGKVNVILVKFDDPNAGLELLARYPQYKNIGVPIFMHELEFHLPSRRGTKKHGARCKVRQFPLMLCWASTAHKVQGDTIPNGTDLVCHGDGRVQAGMLYVMLSRTKCLENLFIDDAFQFSKIKCDQSALQMSNILKEKSLANQMKSETRSIFYTNILSLNKHIFDLEHDIYATQADFLCLSETWLLEDQEIRKIKGYTFHPASWGKGRGVGVFAREKLKFSIIGTYSCHRFQMISLKIYESIQLTVLYLSQGVANDSQSGLLEQLRNVEDPNLLPIIMGDMNFDIKTQTLLSKYLQEKELVQKVDTPTQRRGRIIDHVYIDNNLIDIFDMHLTSAYYSDHIGFSMKLYL